MKKQLSLESQVDEVSGIGPQFKTLLNKSGIITVKDLLLNIPYKYEKKNLTTISNLIVGEKFTVKGKFTKLQNIFTKSRFKIVKGTFEDETGKLDITFFNQPYVIKSTPTNVELYIIGKLDEKTHKPHFINPQIITTLDENSEIYSIYSELNGITSKWFGKKNSDILNQISIPEHLDQILIEETHLPDFGETIHYLHQPKSLEKISYYHKRLEYEEMLFTHLSGLKTQKDWEAKTKGYKFEANDKIFETYIKKIPFTLTQAQIRCIKEIFEDIQKDTPMNRMLQGDVGSGKTLVGAAGLYAASMSGLTSILLAPTQVLANQHFSSIKKLFSNDSISIELITANTSKLPNYKSGSIIIGTHAVLHNLEKLTDIGLIIIDEQHKFGVAQRSQIIDFYTTQSKGITPNLLTMTATPIPRSLALAFYGELSLSVIDEMPKERKNVITWVIQDQKRAPAYDWIKKEIKDNNTQVFIVCPFITDSMHENFSDVKSAETEFKNITNIFSEYKIGLLHGKLKATEKDKIIEDFRNKKFEILVATTVIEVGVDIPNANIMIIENGERLGLASLHQLRGRVGRGSAQGYCIVFSNSEQSKRLAHLETVHNGNKLAEIDLKLRGPGNMYGTSQHGFMDFKFADISDIELIKQTKEVALKVFNNQQKYHKIGQIIKSLKYIGDD